MIYRANGFPTIMIRISKTTQSDIWERRIMSMTLKTITCPQCGKKLCRAKTDSFVELHCHTCKTVVQGTVDKDGGVYALPLEVKPKKAKA